MPESIVIVTGAGASAESGLGTFRDSGGIWDQYDLEDVATPEGFARNPALVHDFYNGRRENAALAQPNAAHEALARLERLLLGRVTLITQNIDGLHERAGSRRIYAMHGRVDRAVCADCAHCWPSPAELSTQTACPACGQRTCRPDVVWFGEMPYHLDEIEQVLRRATQLVVIGTSGTVYPAAGFVEVASQLGAHTVEINLARSEASDAFDRVIEGPASEVVPAWVDEVLGSC
jgi:NAD-dependent deacetylase